MSKHTPGPWTVTTWVGPHSGQTYFFVDHGNYSVAEAIDQIANAHLIAAAPELLAACEEALIEVACKCYPIWTERGRHEPNDTCYLEPILAAAIAKARGTAVPA